VTPETFQLPTSKSFWPKIRNWIVCKKQGSHPYTTAFKNGTSNINKARFERNSFTEFVFPLVFLGGGQRSKNEELD